MRCAPCRPGLDPKLAADIWNNYGSLQGLMGFFSDSERSHAAAMREYAQLGDCQGVRRNLARSGNLMVQLGTLSDAKSYLQQAASLDCPELLAAATSNAPADAAASTNAHERRVTRIRPDTQPARYFLVCPLARSGGAGVRKPADCLQLARFARRRADVGR